MHRRQFLAAALLGFIAVAAGAFGAHALAGRLNPQRMETFQTAVRYQMFHVPVILLVALIQERLPSAWIVRAGWFLVAGVVLFSGSLYMLVLLDQPVLGAVTPIGGALMLAGWLCLAVGATRRSA